MAAAAALARLAAAFLLLTAQVACEYGMVHVVPETGGPRGKDYCILYNPQWAHLPHDLSKASLLQVQDWTASVLCSPSSLPAKGFTNQLPMVARGNCTFYEKVRLAQGSGARGLLIVSKEALVPPGGNKTQYDEIGIPVALLSHRDMLDIFQTFGQAVRAALYAPKEPMLDYNMVIIFIMAVGTVALGGYWAGSRDVRKRYVKHKRDDGPAKQEDEAVDVTPAMIGVFVVTCCSMLVLLYHFYDQLVYAIIGIFCLASSTGLYSCLSPLVQRLPFCKCRVPDNSLPYFHKRPQVLTLLLALLCVAVSVVWGVFRNEDQWAWILQDALGIAFCLYTLKTIRLPTFKACTLLLLVLFIYDVFFVFITPFLTKSGNSIMVEVATGPSDSATHEKLPMVLKVPRLNTSPLALCDRPFSLLGFGDILVPGLLVAYCHRFDIQVQSSRVYFVACTIAYGIGLLVTFMALALMQRGQPALLYLVPCTLVTSCALALWRRELGVFWTGSGFVALWKASWAQCPPSPKVSVPVGVGFATERVGSFWKFPEGEEVRVGPCWGLGFPGRHLQPRGAGLLPSAHPRGPPKPSQPAISLLLQKDLPQPAWAPASADGPQPRPDSDTAPSQQPRAEEPAPSPRPAEQSPEPAAPEETGHAAPLQEPESSAGLAPEPTGLPGPSA